MLPGVLRGVLLETMSGLLRGVLRRSLMVFIAVLLLPGMSVAQAADDANTARAGLELLRQVSDAWRGGNFRGRFVYVRGNRMDSMQVVHAVFDGIEYERLSHLDNTTSEIIRRGDETICVHPDARMTRLDAARAGGPFRAFAAIDNSIAQGYAVARAGQSRVAGRTADYVEIVPRDAHRFGHRIWIDRQSRLPLRYEIVNRKGAALESVEFVDIDTDIRAPKEMFTVPAGPLAQTLSIVRVVGAAVPAVAPVWLPPGFRITGSQTQRVGAAPETVSAVTYSDGLAAFSFFVEKAAVGAKPMGRQVGPTAVVSGVLDAAAAGYFQVTLVGEIPAGTAVKIVESARHHRAAVGQAALPVVPVAGNPAEVLR